MMMACSPTVMMRTAMKIGFVMRPEKKSYSSWMRREHISLKTCICSISTWKWQHLSSYREWENNTENEKTIQPTHYKRRLNDDRSYYLIPDTWWSNWTKAREHASSLYQSDSCTVKSRRDGMILYKSRDTGNVWPSYNILTLPVLTCIHWLDWGYRSLGTMRRDWSHCWNTQHQPDSKRSEHPDS